MGARSAALLAAFGRGEHDRERQRHAARGHEEDHRVARALGEGASVHEAMRVMRMRGIRRIPVVDDDETLAGIVTLDDLLEFVAEELAGLARTVRNEQTREKDRRPAACP